MKRTKKSKSYKIGIGLIILIIAAVGIIWLTMGQPARSSVEVTYS